MSEPALSDRARRVLAALIREYVESGEPVASLTLARRGGFGLSSATLRHVLSELEADGFVHQPHTSAGRVPTDLGYRCYVDMLLQHRRTTRPAVAIEEQLRAQAGQVPLMDVVLANVSHVLSNASHHVGFAVAPDSDDAAFHQIDFVSLTGSKVLVVVVARGGQVSNKVIDIGEVLDPTDLRQAANYLSTEFGGLPLSTVRRRVLDELEQDRTLCDVLLTRALKLARSTFDDLRPQNPVFIEGASSLIDEPDEQANSVAIPTLRALIKMMEDKHRLLRILDEYIEGPGLTVVIGREHTAPDLRPFSLVACTFFDGARTGTVGVLGPTRMRYSRAISVVDSVALALSHVLGEGDWRRTALSKC
jgi:heat-inducible transcriptional repressor